MCSDLEALIGHVNPDILTNCARDAGCTQVTCETTGTTANFFTSIEIGLAPCLTPPEVIIQLYREGSVVELGRNPTQITNVHQIFGVTVLDFFLDFSAATAVQVAVSHNHVSLKQ